MLDGLSADERRREWREHLTKRSIGWRAWVAAGDDGRIVGFCYSGPTRDLDAAADITHPAATAEVYALYLEPEVAGTGVGRELLAHTVEDLRGRGFAAVTLWVLSTNDRARRFYQAAGFRADGAKKTEERPEATLDEIRFRMSLAAGEASPADGTTR